MRLHPTLDLDLPFPPPVMAATSESAAASAASYPPGVMPPLQQISDTQQGGLVAFITGLTLSFVLVSLFIRVYVRQKNGPWKVDDNVLTAASVSVAGFPVSCRVSVCVDSLPVSLLCSIYFGICRGGQRSRKTRWAGQRPQQDNPSKGRWHFIRPGWPGLDLTGT